MNTSSLTLALLICVAGPAGAQDLVTSLDLRTGNQTARASDPSVDDFYGEFKERLEIPVPAYRGLEPKVALRYAFLEGFVDLPLLGRLLSGPSDVIDGPGGDPSGSGSDARSGMPAA